MNTIKFIDLFAGIGGFRLGFENACQQLNIASECVFTSEIKPSAITAYQNNFKNSNIHGDISTIDSDIIPHFDVLLAGFPCQAFSYAGKRHGFSDTRGTLFFEIERLLKNKQPQAFILENVEGLVTNDKQHKNDVIGRTLSIILEKLNDLNYSVAWRVLDAKDFGLAQTRKRIFIVGTKKGEINLDNFPIINAPLKTILQSNLPVINSKLTQLLLTHFSLTELHGKSIKDKRGGKDNIHSWDIALKGDITQEQKQLLDAILLARRNKKWADKKGIKWMDGMPLTLEEISSFYTHPQLKQLLDDLVNKNYLKFEYPKDEVTININGVEKKKREYREDLAKGYNIVAGKLSYEINKILDPETITPTLVATDLNRFVVTDNHGLRRLTLIELCRLFGFPDNFLNSINENSAHDLLGNTLPVPIVTAIAVRLIEQVFLNKPLIQNHLPKKINKQLSLFDSL